MEDIMNLHENKEAFRDAIRATSDHLGIRDIFIEKDYWVTFLLKRLSQSPYAENVVFKGGTSLSKVFNLISRFSEDVDLAILKSEGQSETQERIMIRKVEKELTIGFTEIKITGLTSKQKNFRKTAYNYFKITDTDYSDIHSQLILEINSFADPVPYS
jgi:predicted nucleotidyltransferase component of viral defense system